MTLCPLLAAAFKDLSPGYAGCMYEKCAWYNENARACSIKLIGEYCSRRF